MADLRSRSTQALVAAAIGLAIGAIAHVVIYWGGPDWIEFAGAPDAIVESARDGNWLAPMGTLAITALLAGLAAAALSEAGALPRISFASITLWVSAAIFVLRGLMVAPAVLMGRVNWSVPVDLFIVGSSTFILLIGLLLAGGLALRRNQPTHPIPSI